MSIADDSLLKDTYYTRYEDTHTLIDNKQALEEQVSNPLADDDNDDDVDHEQIELRSVVAESEPAGNLHAYKTSSDDQSPPNLPTLLLAVKHMLTQQR